MKQVGGFFGLFFYMQIRITNTEIPTQNDTVTPCGHYKDK